MNGILYLSLAYKIFSGKEDIMSNSINKKIADILGKMDDKMLQVKLNNAIEILRKGDTEELVKKINKINKDELIQKIDEFDLSRLNNLNIDKNEIKEKINNVDMEKVKSMIGEKGDEIIDRLMYILNQLPDKKG